MFHKHDHGDSIEYRGFALHIETGMSLTKSDQTLQHADRFTILAHLGVLSQELIVGVEDRLCFFSNHRLEDFLDKCDVLAYFICAPRLLFDGFVLSEFRARPC